MKQWTKNNWKRSLIIVVCLVLVIVREVWPHLQFDATTLWLIGVAAAFLLIPDFRIMLPYIKRIKLWEAEIELKEKVEELGDQTEKVQNSVSQGSVNVAEDVSATINEITKIALVSPKAAFMSLSTQIEQITNKRLKDNNVDTGQRYIPLPQAIAIGEKEGIFPKEIGLLVKNFWNVRNKVAHGVLSKDEDSILLSLIFTGIDILRLIVVDNKGTVKN